MSAVSSHLAATYRPVEAKVKAQPKMDRMNEAPQSKEMAGVAADGVKKVEVLKEAFRDPPTTEEITPANPENRPKKTTRVYDNGRKAAVSVARPEINAVTMAMTWNARKPLNTSQLVRTDP